MLGKELDREVKTKRNFIEVLHGGLLLWIIKP